MAWYHIIDKLDDAVKSVVDATFGWSNTLQKERLEKIKTKNEKEILETIKILDEEKKRLDSELKEKDSEFELKMSKENNEEKRKMAMHEQELFHLDFEFKVKMVGNITELVSGLQNEHSRKVMALLTDYKKQQIEIINDLKDSHNKNMEIISLESKKYKVKHPEIYILKLEQIKIELTEHQKLLSDIQLGMNSDLKKIQEWLLDTSRFNAEEFILKIAGGRNQAIAFKTYLEDKKIDLNQLGDASEPDKQ